VSFIFGLQSNSQKHSVQRQSLVLGGHSCPDQKGRKESFICSKKTKTCLQSLWVQEKLKAFSSKDSLKIYLFINL
jgi:hypothetical protein